MDDSLLADDTGCLATHIVLRMRSTDLLPSQVTVALGIEPTNSFAKGDPFRSGSRTDLRQWGVWQFSSLDAVNSTSVERHAQHILKHLEPLQKRLVPFLSDQDCYVDMYVWWESTDDRGGFTVSSSTIRRLSKLCNSLAFTFIAGPQEET